MYSGNKGTNEQIHMLYLQSTTINTCIIIIYIYMKHTYIYTIQNITVQYIVSCEKKLQAHIYRVSKVLMDLLKTQSVIIIHNSICFVFDNVRISERALGAP
jgi:hypothetical protein